MERRTTTIGLLLLCVAVVGLATAWAARERQHEARLHRTTTELEACRRDNAVLKKELEMINAMLDKMMGREKK